MVRFKVREEQRYTLVEFEIDGGVLSPEELTTVSPPVVNLTKGVILSGRGPVWLYGYLVHKYHPAAWVGCYDPRVDSAVVVQSHVPGVVVGSLIPVGLQKRHRKNDAALQFRR